MVEPRKLIILGTGGNAFDILDIVEALNSARPLWIVAGFLDDSKSIGSAHRGLPILGTISSAREFNGCRFINAVGSDASYRRRASIIASTGLSPADFATLVHPLAAVSSRATLGAGSYVCAQANIAGDVVVGDHVAVCPGAIVGHEATVGDYSILAPASCVSGGVEVGPSCYVGARAVIRSRVRLAEGTLVGMGAVVVRPTPEASILVGNPARAMVDRAVPAAPEVAR